MEGGGRDDDDREERETDRHTGEPRRGIIGRDPPPESIISFAFALQKIATRHRVGVSRGAAMRARVIHMAPRVFSLGVSELEVSILDLSWMTFLSRRMRVFVGAKK